ncbi:MAG TPA: SusD/RagB family nutrient-binding outer membrane lipoprotein [Chitinophagaceae bacterium]|nr:SusD/RagB family nutrient-binding outer membrane lipoprotein [Chitinophagaceae bacterium]
MKLFKYSYLSVLAASLLIGSCKKADFVELNTNPAVLYSIKPEEQFLNAPIQIHGHDFEQFYDNYRRIMYWMQQSTAQEGNGPITLKTLGNFNYRYGNFYPSVGATLTDVQKLIEKLPEEDQAKYAQIKAISEVLRIYYAFYVSDINGSIPYSEAFQARYGGTLTPTYESQQALFTLWNKSLKDLTAALKATPSVTQVSLGKNDLYFNGDPALWAKAAAGLRLRLAMRLMKRDAATAAAIANEVIADAANLMTSNAESWVLYADVSFTSGGNWSPVGFRAPKPTVDFMWDNSDPRLRLFYQKNNYTQANLTAAIAAGVYPASTAWNPRQYVGAPISPDVVATTAKSWFVAKKVTDVLSLDTVSYLQYRMFQPAIDGGTGKNFFPIITYADELFMRAELAASGVTTEDAEALYYKGIDASIQFYDLAAKNAKLPDYTAVTDAEITAYKAAADVSYDPAKALNQIAVQAYINFYKQPNEAWALFKRTGMPNSTTVLANEDIRIDNTVYQIPRRAALSAPSSSDLNKANKQAALDDMIKDPSFGTSIEDVYGRVWWDKQ